MELNFIQEKQQLRQNVSLLLKAFSSEEKALKSEFIHAQILSWEKLNRFETIGLYAATPLEVGTFSLFQTLHQRNKKIAFPRVNQTTQTLDFYWVDDWNHLERGEWKVLEPSPTSSQCAGLEKIDLLLVPGVAFDRVGGRLGRGKGFYDRVLKEFRGESLGVAFEAQLFDSIPQDQHDQPVRGLVTEKQRTHFY